ncbi:MAG: type II toxin-antitoxin system ParD family antitoxin [Aphanocapsa lilacina HA4352-LM1]|jgi:antitoxin ParD1/3/4|nr:type II toxin-antitoxin system ParD family antitoxin [Aphanocapsa lilacina HA4352-LM1]
MSLSHVVCNHCGNFIESQLQQGRYVSASEVVRDGLRLLEKQASSLEHLKTSLAGKSSGSVGIY